VPTVGLDGAQAVSEMIGFTQLPYGLTLVVGQQFGYLRLSQAGWSEAICIAASGLTIATCTACFYFVRSQLGIYGLYLFQGAGMGIFFGAYLNLPNLYIATFYSHSIAQARGVPFPFFNLGQMLGPLLLPMLPNFERTGWVAAAALQVVSISVILIAAARIKVATAINAEELGVLLKDVAGRAATAGGVVRLLQSQASAGKVQQIAARGLALPVVHSCL